MQFEDVTHSRDGVKPRMLAAATGIDCAYHTRSSPLCVPRRPARQNGLNMAPVRRCENIEIPGQLYELVLQSFVRVVFV